VKPRARLLERRGPWLGDDYLVTDELGSYIVREGWFQAKGFGVVPDWRETIRIGDVLVARSGTMRVVRECLYKQSDILVSVRLTIRRRSWTGRCYTVVTRSDLQTFGYRKAGVRVRLGSGPMDGEIARNLREDLRTLGPADVRGIA
jgi:hypothetical protein